ncbi:hypothetical protein V8G54_022919 [Vigna mungo]|uniref:Epidermal patterning factor-like protein n=1 Tax=Vigna mungo TaxID=3915 RepID=A0AAQ3N4C6_VIGMU
MDTRVNQTRVCGNVLLLILFCILIFSNSAASTKDSEIGESLVSSRDKPKMLIGSSPPTCISRCEKCTPCKPILVPLTPPAALQTHSASKQHDTASQQSPQALIWKCTCGGKLYNPHP